MRSSYKPSPSPDWNDEKTRLAWVRAMREALDDTHAVVVDLLRPARERELGHVQHRKLYGDGHRSVREMLDFLEGVVPRDPGSGAPVH